MPDGWINVFGGQLRAGYNPPQDLTCSICSGDHDEYHCPVEPEPLTRDELESMALYAEESCCEDVTCDHD